MQMRKINVLFVLILLFFCVQTQAQNNNLRSQFQNINQTTVWPVKGGSYDDIISSFGPRTMYSESRYDFHRGLDIGAELDTKVKAVTDGELFYQTYWEGAGNTVVLRHTFTSPTYFQGKELNYYYTVYMHLDKFKYTEADIGKAIKAGQVIGYVGQTGNATTPHLHLELRVGTWYELEIQLAYPSSQYSGFGFDPAVNPLLLFPPEKEFFTAEVIQSLKKNQDGEVSYLSRDTQPLFNRIKFTIKDTATGQLIKKQILNLNTRLGFDATTNDALDTFNSIEPYIAPSDNSFTLSNYNINVIIPYIYCQGYLTESYQRKLEISDIWGRKLKINL